MKKALFYTFIFVFIATATITLLGLVIKDLIEPGYLDKLFYLLIAESVAPVIVLFKKTRFFQDDGKTPSDTRVSEVPVSETPVKTTSSSKVRVLMLPKNSFPRSSDPHNYTITVYNQETDEENTIDGEPKRANGYLSLFLDAPTEEELIKVKVVNASGEAWESDYFSPNTAKAEMQKI